MGFYPVVDPLWRSEPRHRLLVVGVVVAQRVRSFGLGREEGGSSIAARHSEAGGGGAGEDCCDSFILHRNRGRQPAAENDEQTLAAVLLSMFARRCLSSLSACFASARLIGYRSADL